MSQEISMNLEVLPVVKEIIGAADLLVAAQLLVPGEIIEANGPSLTSSILGGRVKTALHRLHLGEDGTAQFSITTHGVEDNGSHYYKRRSAIANPNGSQLTYEKAEAERSPIVTADDGEWDVLVHKLAGELRSPVARLFMHRAGSWAMELAVQNLKEKQER